MTVSFHSGPVDRIQTGTLFVAHFAGERPLRGEAGIVDWRLHGWLSRLLMEGRIDGTLGSSLLVPAHRLPAQRVVLLGLGDPDDLNDDRLANVAHDVRDKIAGLKEKNASLAMPSGNPEQLERWTRALIDALDGDTAGADLTVVIPNEVIVKLKPSEEEK